MMVVVMPRQESHEERESRFEVSAETLAVIVFEHLLKEGKLPPQKHSVELRFHTDPDVTPGTRVTGATFVARELA